MNRIFEICLVALGAVSLFVVAFLGFAASAGVPLNEVAFVGALLSQEPVDGEQTALEVDEDPVARGPLSDFAVLQSNLGVLASYRLPAPYTGESLQELVDELKAERFQLDHRENELVDRETRVREREETIANQLEALADMRYRLEEEALRLEARAAEVGRDEEVQEERESSVWKTRSELFAEGDAEELASRLTQFSPEDAGRILRGLDPQRAKELLAALTGEQWKQYADAYADGDN